jgi:hypothetical protein
LIDSLPCDLVEAIQDLKRRRDEQSTSLKEKQAFSKLILDKDAYTKQLKKEQDNRTRRDMLYRRKCRQERLARLIEEFKRQKLTQLESVIPRNDTAILPTLTKAKGRRVYWTWNGDQGFAPGKGWKEMGDGVIIYNQRGYNAMHVDMRYGLQMRPSWVGSIYTLNRGLAYGMKRFYAIHHKDMPIHEVCVWDLQENKFRVRPCRCLSHVYVIDKHGNHECNTVHPRPPIRLNFTEENKVVVTSEKGYRDEFTLPWYQSVVVLEGTTLWRYHDSEMIRKYSVDLEEFNWKRMRLLNGRRSEKWSTIDWWPNKTNMVKEERDQKPVPALSDDIMQKKILPFLSLFAANGIY